jgi:hypothetical protein
MSFSHVFLTHSLVAQFFNFMCRALEKLPCVKIWIMCTIFGHFLVKVHRAQMRDRSILRAESIEQRKVRLISRDTSSGTWFESWWVIDLRWRKLRDTPGMRTCTETQFSEIFPYLVKHLKHEQSLSGVSLNAAVCACRCQRQFYWHQLRSALTSRSSNHKVRNESELWLSPKHLSAALISSNAKWSRTSSSNSDARNERDPITFF